jgi:transcriptional regulator with XRE-family HTH domain
MDNILSLEGPSDVQKIIAKALKELRLSKGLTQKTLAQLSGVPQPSLKRFEHSGEISFASLLKISDALGILHSFKSLVESFKAPLTADEVRQRAKKKARVRGSI